jgi:hypothetical protein
MKKQLLNIAFGLLGFSLSAQVPSTVPSNGLISYYGFNSNGNDAISSSIPISNNAISCPDRFNNTNSAYQFNGSNLIKYNGTNPLGTIGNLYQNFTINFWVNSTSSSGSIALGSFGWGYYIGFNNNNNVAVSFIDNASNWNYNYSTNPISTNNWKMITIRKNGSTLSIFIDKVLDNTINSVPNIKTYSSNNCWFGANGQDLNGYLNGKLDDISVYNKPLLQSGIDSLFNNFNSTTSTNCNANITTGLLAQYDFNSNANDLSGNNNNGTINSAILAQDRFGNLNSAYRFNGSESITVPASATINQIYFGASNAFSTSYWVKLDASQNGNLGITYAKGTWNNSNEIFMDLAGMRAEQSGGSNNPKVEGIYNFNQNLWHHVVISHDPLSNPSTKLYLNNVLDTATNSNFTVNNVGGTLYIGHGSPAVHNSGFYGVLDDIRFYNRALTLCDVDTLYTLPNPLASGINENSINLNFILYPNPSNDFITIKGIDVASFEITNLIGQTVIISADVRDNMINISELNNGVYFIIITDVKGKKGVKKIIKH